MRIDYVYDAVYDWETGGVQKRVWELSRRLADDHDIHWYGMHYWDGPPVIEREGVTLHGVKEPTDLYVDGRRKIGQAISFAADVLPALAGTSADVIDCQAFPYFPGFTSRAAASFQRAALCITWHEVWDDYWYEYLGRKGVFGKAVERLLGYAAHTNVAVSARTGRELDAKNISCDYLLPNGIDRAEIDAVSAADEPLDVLFVGRFIPEKNPALVAQAIERLTEEWPDVRCWMVGEGPELTRIRRIVDQRGLSDVIELPGFLDAYDDVLRLLKAADVFLLPSTREGFGITVLEALACGTPVVTIDHPQNAAADLVEDGVTGRLTSTDPDAVADAVTEVRSFAPSDCIASTEPYEWDTLAARAERLYQDIA